MFDKSVENIKYCKKELEKRYCYIYENVIYILAPFIYELKNKKNNKIIITIKELDKNTLYMLENLLLEYISLEETDGYKYFELQKENKEYLEIVKKGLESIKKHNEYMCIPNLKIKLNNLKILEEVYEYIDKQSEDLINKKRKLQVIDEYYRIARFDNSGKIWTSGVKINCTDILNHNLNVNISIPMLTILEPKLRENDDIGVKSNRFIKCFSNTSVIKKDNTVHFTEEEKYKIYLKYNNELSESSLEKSKTKKMRK